MGKIRANQIDMTELKKLAFPIGSIYINTSDDTNPATLLGFGTWVTFSAGKSPVGIDALDTDFDTLGETGGAKTHTLTENEMPVHTHTQNSHNHSQNSHAHDFTHSHGVRYKGFISIDPATAGWNIQMEVSASSPTGTSSTESGGGENVSSPTATNNATTATNSNTGGGGSHNNVQPYVVAKMWKRTA